MQSLFQKLALLLSLLTMTLGLAACGGFGLGTETDAKANAPLSGDLISKIRDIGSSPGAAMMIRIFKQDSTLEVWKQTSSGPYKLLTSYQICSWSGGLGPKVVEGDRQSPEGFYDITPGLMNPYSNYYLAFNTGFPNKFDRAYGRTGSNLMIHGDCSSSGCYAMTDKEIGDIFALMRESFAGGNRVVQLEIFPFRMTPENLAKQAGSPNLPFWQNIKTGYDSFELTKKPPSWDVCDKKYVFNSTGPGGQPLDATAVCPALTTDPALKAELAGKAAADAAAMRTALASGTNAAMQPAAPTSLMGSILQRI
ncbi:MAG TPA: murein L,D-transpeptidase family protein [Devosiaceae bacterium]|nr:murein L,D-transpeptidase family protein [Devosiaceae bacterium]